MASKRRNTFYKNKKRETTEIGTALHVSRSNIGGSAQSAISWRNGGRGGGGNLKAGGGELPGHSQSISSMSQSKSFLPPMLPCQQTTDHQKIVYRREMAKNRHELGTCNGDYENVARRKIPSRRSDCVRTAEFLANLQERALKNPEIGIRALSREMNVAAFTMKLELNEDLRYYSAAYRKGP
ncbi:hypothetical protein AAG570_007924 [Ranatra chinensis]|uniref:Uncharacterized protein n=1 Tax=Ranatra chinensis TaxID=642074 RepID=A0ABD0XTE0_9HEMI